MLSDETATSKNGKNTIRWIKNYLNAKNLDINSSKPLDINEIIKNLKDQVLVIFSKKGYFYEGLKQHKLKKIILLLKIKN